MKNNEDDHNNQTTHTETITDDRIDDLEESDTISTTNHPTIDIKNEVLIKKFGRQFARSKSSLEFTNTTTTLLPDSATIIQNNGKSNTLSDNSNDSPIWDRGIADGVSNQPDSDFDEFSSQDEDDDNNSSTTKKELRPQQQVSREVIGKCKALYSYTPKLYDELELTPGDIIEVYEKQEDGWWLGAINTQTGIFPATYVEEVVV